MVHQGQFSSIPTNKHVLQTRFAVWRDVTIRNEGCVLVYSPQNRWENPSKWRCWSENSGTAGGFPTPCLPGTEQPEQYQGGCWTGTCWRTTDPSSQTQAQERQPQAEINEKGQGEKMFTRKNWGNLANLADLIYIYINNGISVSHCFLWWPSNGWYESALGWFIACRISSHKPKVSSSQSHGW